MNIFVRILLLYWCQFHLSCAAFYWKNWDSICPAHLWGWQIL